MNFAAVAIALKLDYENIPVPEKVDIQLAPGEIKFLATIKYQQHESDPLSAVNLVVRYEDCDRIQIAMDLVGRLVLRPGGEFKFGGTKLVLVCTPKIEDNHFKLLDADIKEIHLPLLPRLFKNFLRELVNRSFVPNLNKSLHFDLENMLEVIRNKINALEPVCVEVGVRKYFFQILPNIGEVNHQLRVTPEAVFLDLEMAFAPEFAVEVK